ncbi:MAG: peptidylprolyl isomerase [Thermoplasmata archaeon HGW-Thermoplasmata-1]|nr:MAG: peptidylprolyl isomerase [Thermoplasmata archaeon HGW-Thermoplasmata-1]
MAIEKGDTVKVEYEGTLEDGTVFDCLANHVAPLEFEIGAGHILPGFENALIGKEAEDEVEINLDAKEAYGEVNEMLVQTVPRDQIPIGEELEAGMVLMATLPNGASIPARICEVYSEMVTVDMNHPLAGKSLNFKVRIVDVSS